MSLSHPAQVFETYTGGTLPRESQPISVSLKLLKEEANAPLRSPTPAGRSVVASYADVYGHKWKSKRDLSFDIDEGMIKQGHLIVTPLEDSHDS